MRPTSRIRIFLAMAATLIAWAQAPASPPFQSRPLSELIAEARVATPPQGAKSRRTPDLVDLTALDSFLRFDIGYASKDNFLHAPIYTQAKAFLQRPVAEALLRVNRALQRSGYTLRIRDAYRPWWVTKVFWEATPPDKRVYVADPAKGSVHNRGCAVDVDLIRLADGSVVPMPSDYDEMSIRSHLDYSGGPAQARAHRDLLRSAMEGEGFKAYQEEWWHFDHPSSIDYPILNVPFEALCGPSPDLVRAGQVLLVTTLDWNSPRGLLQRFERSAGTLVRVGSPLPVWIGHTGMAWRSDENAPVPPGFGPVKREGDGRSPAGILTFGEMWGYSPRAPEGTRFPYRSATECDRCVDDPNHSDYGKVVHLDSPGAPVTWKSAERLRLDTEHYRYLLVIHYNDLRPRKSAGSCIFLHVAPPLFKGTAGCTALDVDSLLLLLRWMDPDQHPVLVQIPEPLLDAVSAAWSLPAELLAPTP